jgi:hypothetical protein
MFQPDNTDQAAGYEVGLKQGRERIAGRLFDRKPPGHFDWSRRAQWSVGYDAGLRERSRKDTVVTWTDPATGSVTSKTFRGHANRNRVVSKLARDGVYGDVMVAYYSGSEMLREHRCGI